MDIYTLLAKMRKARRKHTISAGAQGLFQELMAINNEERWCNVFRCRNAELEGAMNITEKTLAVYRNELVAAGLVTFKSGKSKRIPCDYSLNGSNIGDTIDSSIGDTKGRKIYGQSVSQSVEKTPDINIKEKSNTESKTLEEGGVSARAAEIDEAVNCFCNPVMAYPEKEKNVAPKKERVLPALEEVIIKVAETAMWRNVLEHKLIPDDLKPKWDTISGIDKDIYVQEREDLFREFYEVKEDTYLVSGLPTWAKMAENFYYWVGIRKNIALTNLKGILNGNKSKLNGIAKNGNAGDRNARNQSITDVVNGSAAFLQQYPGIDHS